ncbi:uncharacterized protein SPAPADRAFT_58236 [Spathaspora passalidarum NRRL Y-27907]|uniref:Uncharacterized protein n=1 Tax=Spathaspora passalidarum (strain NRRL Y-27907 / 11-Y1) TaxID=619300 RepID=G3AFV5_SPAPN|nr:uncharacterized protein SPAPADRAFT_58236 [Spathaspora passalidarum NRRL Y-27907]EGW35094.1 hypothetical protein SPAPADRAFT_58236 [Spathaspora passalidarum NRRL Y-27907]
MALLGYEFGILPKAKNSRQWSRPLAVRPHKLGSCLFYRYEAIICALKYLEALD